MIIDTGDISNSKPNYPESEMSVDKAIELLEEFKVIDDWSAVYMPDLHDAIDVALDHLKSYEKPKYDADIATLKDIVNILVSHIMYDGEFKSFSDVRDTLHDLIIKLYSH